jgi:hypothetical protein
MADQLLRALPLPGLKKLRGSKNERAYFNTHAGIRFFTEKRLYRMV